MSAFPDAHKFWVQLVKPGAIARSVDGDPNSAVLADYIIGSANEGDQWGGIPQTPDSMTLDIWVQGQNATQISPKEIDSVEVSIVYTLPGIAGPISTTAVATQVGL